MGEKVTVETDVEDWQQELSVGPQPRGGPALQREWVGARGRVIPLPVAGTARPVHFVRSTGYIWWDH